MQPAIRAENLGKQYRLGLTHARSLNEAAARWTRKLRGLPPTQDVIGDQKNESDTRGSFWALQDVNFEVQPGEVVGVIGRNGAGKSTLLKILSRVTKPTTGQVDLRGRVGSLLEVGTGFHPELTGRENVYMNGTLLGMTKREVDRRFDEIVEFAGVGRFIDTPVKRYSSGMKVRLGFAVAAHLEPEILIIDEVLAVGDQAFQDRCFGKMRDVTRHGRTIFLVSHNLTAIRALSSVVIELRRGTIRQHSADVSEALTNYLSETRSSECPGEWIAPPQFEGAPEFRPTRFAVTDAAGNAINHPVWNGDEVWVRIDTVIEHQNPLLTVGYALRAESGEILYWSYQTDRTAAGKEIEPLPVGRISLRSRIPMEMLNRGRYQVLLISSIHKERWFSSPDAPHAVVGLLIEDISDRPRLWAGRPTPLVPMLPWRLDMN